MGVQAGSEKKIYTKNLIKKIKNGGGKLGRGSRRGDLPSYLAGGTVGPKQWQSGIKEERKIGGGRRVVSGKLQTVGGERTIGG